MADNVTTPTKLKRNRDVIRDWRLEQTLPKPLRRTIEQVAAKYDLTGGHLSGIYQRYTKRLSRKATKRWGVRIARSQRFGKTSKAMPLEIWELPFGVLLEFMRAVDARYDEERGWLLPYFIPDMERVHLPIQEWMRRLRLVGEELAELRARVKSQP